MISYGACLFLSDLLHFSMIISRSVHIAANVLFHSFIWLSIIPLYIHTISSLSNHLSMDRCFYVLAIINSTAMSIEVHISFLIIVLTGCMTRNGVVGSYGNFIFSFLRNLGDCTNLCSHQQCKRNLFSPGQ